MSEDPGDAGEGRDDEQASPRATLMRVVAEQMDAIEADFGDNFTIGSVVTVVEVQPHGDTPGIRVRANVPPWVGIGMLRYAERSMGG